MNNAPQTSVSLILKVANERDVAAWDQFTQIYQPLVYRIALSRGLQPADAHDLVQDVMTRVARSVSKWNPDKGKGTFRGWISRIARNLIIDFMRQRNRLPKTSDQSDIRKIVESVPASSDEESMFNLEYDKQLFFLAAKNVRSSFAENTWQAFWRTSVDNEAVEVVASDLKMTCGAVYVARSRVMAKLKRSVKQLCDEEGLR